MNSYQRLREQARQLFAAEQRIRCPYFDADIVLNAEGLHHMRYSADRERSKSEQILKFRLLPLALETIRKSGTVQEYRRIWQPIGKSGADGMRSAKEVEYWVLVAIIGPRPDKIRVVLRRVVVHCRFGSFGGISPSSKHPLGAAVARSPEVASDGERRGGGTSSWWA